MLNAIIGRKIQMASVFDAEGNLVPVTAVRCGPCVVVQVKTPKTDRYAAVQIGLVERIGRHALTRPEEGHLKKAQAPRCRVLREVRVALPAGAGSPDLSPGDRVTAAIFQEGDLVDVTGWSKGKGFQGVIRRHHFGGGAATHGSMFHRAPGSIGGSSYPSRVWRGQKAAGHMGYDKTTVRNLRVIRVDAEQNLVLIEGAVPGHRNTTLVVRKAKTPPPAPKIQQPKSERKDKKKK